MRILHISPIFPPALAFGGQCKSVFELCRELARQGAEVSVYTSNADVAGTLPAPAGKFCPADGVEVTYFPLRFRPGFICRGLGEALRNSIGAYDLLHLHGFYQYFTSLAAYQARRVRVPYLVSPRGMLDPFAIRRKGWWKKWLYIELVGRRELDLAAGIHFTAEEERRLVERFGFKGPGFVVPNGIDPAEYGLPPGENHLLGRYPHLSGKRIILYLGRLDPKKGLDLLLDAFRRIAGRVGDLILLVAGFAETKYARSLKRSARNLEGRVIFPGFLRGEEKLWAFHMAELFVLPSYSENFGIALLEAFCCAKPVVTTNRVNLAPDVREYGAGLITPCDAEKIAEAMVYLLDHPEEAGAMGRQGRRLAQDRFTWPRVAGRMMEAYRAILEGGARRGPRRKGENPPPRATAGGP